MINCDFDIVVVVVDDEFLSNNFDNDETIEREFIR